MRDVVVFVLMVWFSLLSGGATSGDQNAVRIKRVSTPTSVSLVLENRRAYDATVTLTIHAENAQVTRIIPETATCVGQAQIEAARICPIDPGKRWRWRCNLHWAKGSMSARHDRENRYRLPFQGNRI